MKLEIYRRPKETPYWIIEDKDIRIYYNGKWFDFRNGDIHILDDKTKTNKPLNV